MSYAMSNCMATSERLHIPAGLNVKRQLLLVAKAVCLIERKTMPYPEIDTVQGWKSPFGRVGLDGVHLSKPLKERGFRVVQAELSLHTQDGGISVYVDANQESQVGRGFNYDTDPFCLEILSGFREYIATHPHAECIRERRLDLQAANSLEDGAA